jgi:hypothetical protein
MVMKKSNLILMCGFVCLVAFNVFIASSRGAIDPESVQGAWLFDEGQGDEVLDSSGKDHHGSFTADDIQRVEGIFGGALEFFGGGEVVVPHDDAFTTPTFTLMAWVKVHEIPTGWTTRLLAKDGWPDRNYGIYVAPNSGVVHFAFCAPGQADVGNMNGNTPIADDQWHHIAMTYDLEMRRIYVDGKLDQESSMNIVPSENTVDIQIGTGPVGLMDEVLIANEAFAIEDIQTAMQQGVIQLLGGTKVASKPEPVNGAEDVIRDIKLSWQISDFAVTHNVYFDENLDAINADDPSALAAEGLDVNTLSFETPLDFGQTYYWRVDEVNGAPDFTVFTGDIWSFTVEPFAYPITNITATSSSNTPGMGPEKTIDGSGLNANDEHSTEQMDMWFSDVMDPQPAWIQYEFEKVYKLFELWVWNSNQMFETSFGIGAKDVTVEYSEDGVKWTLLGDVEFTQATGSADYTHNTTINIDNVLAKYVRLNINSNWKGLLPQYSLSEVRFFYIPVQAREPKPASGSKGVARDVVLDWRVGREAASHEVFFSQDKEAVTDGTAPMSTVSESSYQPAPLDFGQIYYWKVNEVNDTASTPSWEGIVWSFSTIEYFVVDDFESYNDLNEGEPGSNRIYLAWIDGFSNPAINGSTVGNLNVPFTEQAIVRSGRQSMPYLYDNGVGNSEATLTLSDKRNWTTGGVTELSVWFRGDPNNVAEKMYIALNGSAVVYHDNLNAPLRDTWTQWNIDLTRFADQGVSLDNVNSIAIGFGDKSNPSAGGSGTMLFDDITVGHPVSPVGLVAHFALENNTEDSSGNGHHGTVVGNPVYIDGLADLGMALEFDGTGAQYVDLGTFNPSEVTDKLSVCLWVKWNGLTSFWQGLIGKRDTWASNEMMWQIEANQTTGVVRFQREGISEIQSAVLPIGEWAHVAATFDGTTGRIYINGQMTGEGAFSLGSDPQAAIQFGASEANGGNSFNGALDDIRIYDFVLSDAEVLELAGK